MNSESTQPRYTLDIGGEIHEVGSSAFRVWFPTFLRDTAKVMCCSAWGEACERGWKWVIRRPTPLGARCDHREPVARCGLELELLEGLVH